MAASMWTVSVGLLLLAVAPLSLASPPTVYIVAHTHLDVGWLQTFDSYYYLNVSSILPGVISELAADPTKTFVWAEIAYFKRWYDTDASDAQKSILLGLVARKQFEFVDGGIVQHDQACPTAYSIASQMTQGHAFLRATYGVAPRIGWSIDPFGSSTSNAALYALMKFDGLVINRVGDRAIGQMQANRSFEFLWQPSSSIPAARSQIFTHVFDSYFCMPGGFRWGMNGNNDADITPANVAARAQELVKDLAPRLAWYRTPNLLVPWGCDFMFQNATRVFRNTDALIAYINAHSDTFGMVLKYATASQYFDAVTAGGLSLFPTRGHADFFPLVYQGSDHGKPITQVWSGYYSSRPVLKALSSLAESLLRGGEALFGLVRGAQTSSLPTQPFFDDIFGEIEEARWDSSIVLHHDAITGTGCASSEGCTGADQMGGDHDVVGDYMSMLTRSAANSLDAIGKLLSFVLSSDMSTQPTLLPFSSPQVSAFMQRKQTVSVLFFNPNSNTQTEVVTLSVPVSWVSVVGPDGAPVPFQMNARDAVSIVLPHGSGHRRSLYVSFQVTVAPFGFSTYFLVYSPPSSQCEEADVAPPAQQEPSNGPQQLILENSNFRITADNVSGVQSVLDKRSGQSYSLNVQLRYYDSLKGDAYSFSVNGTSQPFTANSLPEQVQLVSGSMQDELFMQFSSQHAVVVRLFKAGQTEGFQLEFDIGVLAEDTDVVAVVQSSINSGSLLYTDSNGIDTMQRLNDSTLTMEENSWPATSYAYIQDASSQLGLVFEQVHTVQSLVPGQLQVILHRRSRNNDVSGAVVIDDTLPHRETAWVSLGTIANATHARHTLAASELVVVAASTPSVAWWTARYATAYAPLADVLPQQVEMFSLQATDATASALAARWRHVYLANEDAVLSQPGTVNITAQFEKVWSVQAANVAETSLSFLHQEEESFEGSAAAFGITAGDIRSFVIQRSD